MLIAHCDYTEPEKHRKLLSQAAEAKALNGLKCLLRGDVFLRLLGRCAASRRVKPRP
jgi:hypothetical protein